MTEKWVKMGVVGVDSGQLMICDPCYLNGWDKDDEYHDSRQYEDVETGKRYTIWEDFKGYEDKIDDYNGKTPNELIRDKSWKEVPYEPPFKFGYNYVSHREKKYKQIPYQMGHAGLAVAFDSGLGDGEYEVWGRIAKVEGWGERITDVLIKLVDTYAAEEILDYFNKVYFSK